MDSAPPIPAIQRSPGGGLTAPLNLPACLTWLTVVLGPLIHGVDGASTAIGADLGLLAQLAFLPALLARAWIEGRRPGSPWIAVLLGVQTLLALVAIAGLSDHMSAVLLVLVAVQTPALRAPRAAIVLMSAGNALLLPVFAHTLPADKVVRVWIAYAAFQIFAALLATHAYRIQASREQTLRINAELLATRRLLEEGTRAEERLRLSRDLHDAVGHKLTALRLRLLVRARTAGALIEGPALETDIALVGEVLDDIRGVVSALREHDGIDLHAALRALDPGLPSPRVSIEIDESIRAPDIHHAEVIVRCAQEAITNALRHSRATEIRIVLSRTAGGVTLLVEDDGHGRLATLRQGNGLQGLQERLRDLGGTLSLRNRSPRGLQLMAELPGLARP